MREYRIHDCYQLPDDGVTMAIRCPHDETPDTLLARLKFAERARGNAILMLEAYRNTKDIGTVELLENLLATYPEEKSNGAL